MTIASTRSDIRPRPRLPTGTMPALGTGLAVALAAAVLVAWGTALGTLFVTVTVCTYALVAGLVLVSIGWTHEAVRFGLPNVITLARVVATALVTGYTVGAFAGGLAGGTPPSELVWFFAALATAAILADGVDGWVARHRGPATAFGARFDMEVDALLLLVLSGLAVALDRAGSWVLLIGALRYLFIGAGRLMPWLEAPLPPSTRRKAVCVIQGTVLVLLATPVLPPQVAAAAAAVALSALVWSFAVDVVWLARHRTSAVAR